jgi:hypothetical protein
MLRETAQIIRIARQTPLPARIPRGPEVALDIEPPKLDLDVIKEWPITYELPLSFATVTAVDVGRLILPGQETTLVLHPCVTGRQIGDLLKEYRDHSSLTATAALEYYRGQQVPRAWSDRLHLLGMGTLQVLFLGTELNTPWFGPFVLGLELHEEELGHTGVYMRPVLLWEHTTGAHVVAVKEVRLQQAAE